MTNSKTLRFAFRRPRFPMICAIDGNLIGARSSGELGRDLARFDLETCESFSGVDAKGEKWMLVRKEMLLAPEFMIGRVRKAEVIRLFNESRTANDASLSYPEHVIGNRRLDMIVHDLVVLIDRAK